MNNTRLLVSRIARSNSYSLVMEKEASTPATIEGADALTADERPKQRSFGRQPRNKNYMTPGQWETSYKSIGEKNWIPFDKPFAGKSPTSIEGAHELIEPNKNV